MRKYEIKTKDVDLGVDDAKVLLTFPYQYFCRSENASFPTVGLMKDYLILKYLIVKV